MIKPVLCTEAVKRLPLVETPNSPVFFVEKHGSLKQTRGASAPLVCLTGF